MYRTCFTVRGSGTFPFDMLRYDRCTPYTQSDVYAMLEDRTEKREVHLIMYHKYKNGGIPTAVRWESFLWHVTHCKFAEKIT